MRQITAVDQAVGWYGAMAVLAAYVCVTFGIVSPQGSIYQFLNLTGSLAIIYISYLKTVYQSVFLNVVWAAIAAVALIRLFV